MYPEDLPLSDDLRAAHEAALDNIARPGPSWTGNQRLEMVRVARASLNCTLCAGRKAALSPAAVTGQHDNAVEQTAGLLPESLNDAIHRIRSDPGRLTRSWFDSVIKQVSQPAYVEMVSVVNSVVIIDTLHRSLGLALPELPEPVAGEASGDPTGAVVDDGAWVPISQAPRDMADTGLPAVPNIFRAMGLVPAAVGLFFATFRPHYALKDIPLSISQAQAEFVASRVSAMNECFYWTTSHTMLLRASGERDNEVYDLTAVTGQDRDSGVANEHWLRQLTELAISGDWTQLAETLDAASGAMGRQPAVDALVVASAFNGITRVADATGIPLDENTSATTTELRATVGLDAFDYAEKSRRFG